MGNTSAGGKQSVLTTRERFGHDFFKQIGAVGGHNSRTGGFYANRELARAAGRVGGLSRRKYPRGIAGVRLERKYNEAVKRLTQISEAAKRDRESSKCEKG